VENDKLSSDKARLEAEVDDYNGSSKNSNNNNNNNENENNKVNRSCESSFDWLMLETGYEDASRFRTSQAERRRVCPGFTL
jgi:hypothetical protein